ncbi:MAG: amidohydrolase family protein [Acidimicrobiaceae bacterium]|nr:amidohydrolase family protein [Acidimicrobiaceae bacterium]
MHIIDPRFPLVQNQGYVPEFFGVGDYRESTASVEVLGGVVVAGSFQGFDQTYLVNALRDLGPNFVGVAQVPPDIDEEELLFLNERGVRAIRFNLFRTGSESISQLEEIANRVWDLHGWHSELYVDPKDLHSLKPLIRRLPKVSIDHLGMAENALDSVLDLVAAGAKVKATGFGRVDLDVVRTLKKIHSVDPNALMAGTDLPSTRAKRRFSIDDLHLIQDTFQEETDLILHKNSLSFYRVGDS